MYLLLVYKVSTTNFIGNFESIHLPEIVSLFKYAMCKYTGIFMYTITSST